MTKLCIWTENNMPIYEYLCNMGCSNWEVLQRLSEPPIKKCPTCNKNTARRLISGCGFILKGKGFYKPSINKEDL